MKIIIDTDNCCAAGSCVMAASDFFDQDDDGIVIVLDAEPGEDRDAAVREVGLCPAGAITVAARP